MKSVLTRGMFHLPTDYYCEALDTVDEHLCALLV